MQSTIKKEVLSSLPSAEDRDHSRGRGGESNSFKWLEARNERNFKPDVFSKDLGVHTSIVSKYLYVALYLELRLTCPSKPSTCRSGNIGMNSGAFEPKCLSVSDSSLLFNSGPVMNIINVSVWGPGLPLLACPRAIREATATMGCRSAELLLRDRI
ncbi:hypothetical protein AXG93_592s1030 [Marchantia polymorpha subsp. ruderalis]|uniref:Uncharacterized protein n=1 Tax=Marchantia polymorpha subsp. ruderalis TaxID=1480154 RepID=A0A176VF21_MARPO|nr:hypothetical protein AXG93_592s1030 [Marchantia polymorpha subsp. ruderalis]